MSLSFLPAELQLDITYYQDYLSRLRMSITNNLFWSLLAKDAKRTCQALVAFEGYNSNSLRGIAGPGTCTLLLLLDGAPS